MPYEGLTREVIRQRVGDSIEGFFLGTTTTAPGDDTSVIDTSAYGGTDAWKGHWIRFYSGTLDGEVRRVSDFDGAGDHTVSPAFSDNVPSGANYERWPPEYHPERIDRFINQAITEVIGRVYKSETNPAPDTSPTTALHGDGRQTRFDIPSEFDEIHKIEYAQVWDADILHDCNSAWDESVDSDFTVTADTEHKKVGSSVKFSIAGTVSDGDFATDSIGSVDISAKTHVGFWVYVETAVAASDLALLLDNTASCASPVETLTLPAVSARTWTYVIIQLANPEDDTAIISIGLEYNANSGANTVWLDRIEAFNYDSIRWAPLGKNLWYIDQEASDLMLWPAGRSVVGSRLMKLYGGSNPAQLTTDAGTATVHEDYLVEKALALAKKRAGDDDWTTHELAAQRAKGKLATGVNVRKVS